MIKGGENGLKWKWDKFVRRDTNRWAEEEVSSAAAFPGVKNVKIEWRLKQEFDILLSHFPLKHPMMGKKNLLKCFALN